jgi:hypothetical protein
MRFFFALLRRGDFFDTLVDRPQHREADGGVRVGCSYV